MLPGFKVRDQGHQYARQPCSRHPVYSYASLIPSMNKNKNALWGISWQLNDDLGIPFVKLPLVTTHFFSIFQLLGQIPSKRNFLFVIWQDAVLSVGRKWKVRKVTSCLNFDIFSHLNEHCIFYKECKWIMYWDSHIISFLNNVNAYKMLADMSTTTLEIHFTRYVY